MCELEIMKHICPKLNQIIFLSSYSIYHGASQQIFTNIPKFNRKYFFEMLFRKKIFKCNQILVQLKYIFIWTPCTNFLTYLSRGMKPTWLKYLRMHLREVQTSLFIRFFSFYEQWKCGKRLSLFSNILNACSFEFRHPF